MCWYGEPAISIFYFILLKSGYRYFFKPTLISVPTMDRTMFLKKRLAEMVKQLFHLLVSNTLHKYSRMCLHQYSPSKTLKISMIE
jgi:hypothetical protein